jgi:DNA damage-binding protein 1
MEVDGAGPGAGAAACCNYVVTAHKPTVVTHAVVANFTSPSDINLITA